MEKIKLLLFFIFTFSITIYAEELSKLDEIIIINEYEDNTSDYITSFSFFDSIISMPNENENGFYDTLYPLLYENKNEILASLSNLDIKPFYFDLQSLDIIHNKEYIPIKMYSNNFISVNHNTTEGKHFFEIDSPSFELEHSIITNQNIISYFTEYRQKISQNFSLIFPTLFNIMPTEYPFAGTGFVFDNKKTKSKNSFLFSWDINSAFPILNIFSESSFDSSWLRADFKVSRSNINHNSEYILRLKSFIFEINSSLILLPKASADFSLKFSYYTKHNSITFFAINNKENNGFFTVHDDLIFKSSFDSIDEILWNSGIKHTFSNNHLTISNSISASYNYLPFKISEDMKLPTPPSILFRTTGIVILPKTMFGSEIIFEYNLIDLLKYQFSLKLYELSINRFNFSSETTLSGKYPYNGIYLLNNVKLDYSFKEFGILYVKIDLYSNFFDKINTKYLMTVGCILTL